eukprot:Awhi_evm1s12827
MFTTLIATALILGCTLHAHPTIDEGPVTYKPISFVSDPHLCAVAVATKDDQLFDMQLGDCSSENVVNFVAIHPKVRLFSALETGPFGIAPCMGIRLTTPEKGAHLTLVHNSKENNSQHILAPCVDDFNCFEFYTDKYEPTGLCIGNNQTHLVLDDCKLDNYHPRNHTLVEALDDRISIYFDSGCTA